MSFEPLRRQRLVYHEFHAKERLIHTRNRAIFRSIPFHLARTRETRFFDVQDRLEVKDVEHVISQLVLFRGDKPCGFEHGSPCSQTGRVSSF